MEQVQRLYTRLRLADPGHCQVASVGLPSLLRPPMKRSHTFAATSSRPLALSSALHSSPPEQRQVNGHGAVTHTPELNDVEDHHPSDEYIGYEDQTLVSHHPTRPLAYSYPLSSGESGNFRSVAGRKYGWTSSTTRLNVKPCLLYTSPSPRDIRTSRMPSSA